MLAYRHLFHAGNFADVFKHALLTQLLLGLTRKGKPFFYLDTHAGIGRYDLTQEWARKNAERRAPDRTQGPRGPAEAGPSGCRTALPTTRHRDPLRELTS